MAEQIELFGAEPEALQPREFSEALPVRQLDELIVDIEN